MTAGDRREILAITRPSLRRVELFEIAAPRDGRFGSFRTTTGGRFHPRLNKSESPIAHKYREGKMQSTPKGEFKVLEIVKRETIEPVSTAGSKTQPGASSQPESRRGTSGRTFWATGRSASLSDGRRKANGKSPTREGEKRKGRRNPFFFPPLPPT